MRTLTCLTVCAGLLATPAAAQRSPADSSLRFLVRLSGGSLNPDDPFTGTPTYGAQVGWRVTPHSVVLVSGMRQDLSFLLGGTRRYDLRHYLALGYEHYFGPETLHRQQLALRATGGAVFRSGGDAPFVSGGLSIRYSIGRSFAFIGTLEDVIAALPDEVEHNFGMFISLELRQ